MSPPACFIFSFSGHSANRDSPASWSRRCECCDARSSSGQHEIFHAPCSGGACLPIRTHKITALMTMLCRPGLCILRLNARNSRKSFNDPRRQEPPRRGRMGVGDGTGCKSFMRMNYTLVTVAAASVIFLFSPYTRVAAST